jgi:hypothetical protein
LRFAICNLRLESGAAFNHESQSQIANQKWIQSQIANRKLQMG